MSTEVELIIEQLKELNSSVMALRENLADFKTEVRTSLTETNGKMKGNFELLERSIVHLEKQNELQHDALKHEMHSVNGTLENHKKQIDRLFDLDRDRAKHEEDMQLAIMEKTDTAITAACTRLDGELDTIRDTIQPLIENSAITKSNRTLTIAIIGVLVPMLGAAAAWMIKLWAVVQALGG